MKMFGKNSVSIILFYLSRVSAIGVLLFVLFILFSWFTGGIQIDQEGVFNLQIPLSNSVIKGKYTMMTLLAIMGTFTFYSAFLYLLSLLFRVFTVEPLFTPQAIKYLSYFTIINIILPVGYFLVMLVVQQASMEDIAIVTLHLTLGLFAAFISAIFKQGVVLQEEQNLTI